MLSVSVFSGLHFLILSISQQNLFISILLYKNTHTFLNNFNLGIFASLANYTRKLRVLTKSLVK